MSEDIEEPIEAELPDIPESTPVEPEGQAVSEPSDGESSTPATDAWQNFRSMQEFQGADDQQIASRLYEAMQREQAATHALLQFQTIMPATSEYLSNRELYEQWKR